jgi:hypothetical protein
LEVLEPAEHVIQNLHDVDAGDAIPFSSPLARALVDVLCRGFLENLEDLLFRDGGLCDEGILVFSFS